MCVGAIVWIAAAVFKFPYSLTKPNPSAATMIVGGVLGRIAGTVFRIK
jgi:hypothetical protein